jgi:hypothetical protein
MQLAFVIVSMEHGARAKCNNNQQQQHNPATREDQGKAAECWCDLIRHHQLRAATYL